MRYRITKQGYGSLVEAKRTLINRELTIKVNAEGQTVKLVTEAEGSPFYSKVIGGVCKFPRAALVGDIEVSVITTQGVIPCTPLFALETTSGTVVYPDAKDVMRRLSRAEKDISAALEQNHSLEEKYNDLNARRI